MEIAFPRDIDICSDGALSNSEYTVDVGLLSEDISKSQEFLIHVNDNASVF